MGKKRVVVILGSESDLPQCAKGLEYLKRAEERLGLCEVVSIEVMSVHRNLPETLSFLSGVDGTGYADIIIAAAGWAAHLPGIIDSYLGYALKNTEIVIIGVALEDMADEQHTLAAKLSISEVPGTRVIFGDARGQYVGEEGFLNACRSASVGPLPKPKAMTPRPTKRFSLDEALAEIEKKAAASVSQPK